MTSETRAIVICDDDPVVRLLLSECLSMHGHTVTAFGSPAECLAHLATTIPDILFLDVIMPEQSGFDVLRAVRERPALAALPVVMLSANAEDRRLQAAAGEVKPNHFLEKPWAMPKLLTVVQELTKR